MKSLILDLWVEDGDNIDFSVEISDELYDKLKTLFDEFVAESEEPFADEDDAWDCFGEEYDLADIVGEDEAAAIAEAAREDVRRSFEESCYDEDDPEAWEEEFNNCSWGYRIKGITAE